MDISTLILIAKNYKEEHPEVAPTTVGAAVSLSPKEGGAGVTGADGAVGTESAIITEVEGATPDREVEEGEPTVVEGEMTTVASTQVTDQSHNAISASEPSVNGCSSPNSTRFSLLHISPRSSEFDLPSVTPIAETEESPQSSSSPMNPMHPASPPTPSSPINAWSNNNYYFSDKQSYKYHSHVELPICVAMPLMHVRYYRVTPSNELEPAESVIEDPYYFSATKDAVAGEGAMKDFLLHSMHLPPCSDVSVRPTPNFVGEIHFECK